MTGAMSDVRLAVRILHAADGLALGEVEEVFVAIWRASVSKSLFEWQRHCMAESMHRHPNGSAFLCVIEPTSKPPDDELRRASAAMVATHQDRLKCIGVVIEGQGFRAAITRGVLSGMVLLLPNRKVPVSYLSTVAEAADSIDQHFPIRSKASFVAGVSRVRAHLVANASS